MNVFIPCRRLCLVLPNTAAMLAEEGGERREQGVVGAQHHRLLPKRNNDEHDEDDDDDEEKLLMPNAGNVRVPCVGCSLLQLSPLPPAWLWHAHLAL